MVAAEDLRVPRGSEGGGLLDARGHPLRGPELPISRGKEEVAMGACDCGRAECLTCGDPRDQELSALRARCADLEGFNSARLRRLGELLCEIEAVKSRALAAESRVAEARAILVAVEDFLNKGGGYSGRPMDAILLEQIRAALAPVKP